MFGLRKRRPSERWDHRFDALADYNSLVSRAYGSQYSMLDTPELRDRHRKDAEHQLAALSSEYVAEMATLQREYNDRMATR